MKQEDDFIVLGNRLGQGHPFGLSTVDRSQHTYLIGQTGSGKSTLMRNMIVQDIWAGRGVALIDYHGDQALDILDCIPPWRTDDVVYFDPMAERPVPLNLFRLNTGNWARIASGIVSSFEHIWHASWGPRTEYLLLGCLCALLQCQNTSLFGVSRMLGDDQYRSHIMKQVKDPYVDWLWTREFPEYRGTLKQEVVGPVQNKVGALFMSPPLRRVLGQVGSTIDFRFMMDDSRIFIANLSKGMLGETPARLLGSLIVSGFELAAASRADMPSWERTPFYLFVDEFQNCATESFATILSESRKYGLCLTLAHQYLGQLPEGLPEAVFGNVGSLIAFRVSEADASVLERQYGSEYTAAHFTGLENFEICAKLLRHQPFIGRTLPPMPLDGGRREVVLKRSAEKYGRDGKAADDRIAKWLGIRH